MTKEQFLARCANAYDMGLCTPERLRLLDRWLDFVLRFEGGQMRYAVEFLDAEVRRNRTATNGAIGMLAGDDDGYALNVFAAILTHKCQTCAEDPDACHTRGAFCPHKQQEHTDGPLTQNP